MDSTNLIAVGVGLIPVGIGIISGIFYYGKLTGNADRANERIKGLEVEAENVVTQKDCSSWQDQIQRTMTVNNDTMCRLFEGIEDDLKTFKKDIRGDMDNIRRRVEKIDKDLTIHIAKKEEAEKIRTIR